MTRTMKMGRGALLGALVGVLCVVAGLAWALTRDPATSLTGLIDVQQDASGGFSFTTGPLILGLPLLAALAGLLLGAALPAAPSHATTGAPLPGGAR